MSAGYNLQFKKLCKNLHLGELVSDPTPLLGGHLHKMFMIETDIGKYAIKAINPQVMLRPAAKQNYINSERISKIASKAVPALPAKLFSGSVMPEVDGQFYLVFDWIDGEVHYNENIDLSQCKTMGKVLALLHSTDFNLLGLADTNHADEKMVDWDFYLKQSILKNADWSEFYNQHLDSIHQWNNRVILADGQIAKSGKVISHRDLEPKNVMWCNNNPVVIDWEAAGFINPLQDLVETALYWSSDLKGETIPEKFKAFAAAYSNHLPIKCDDWETVLDKGLSANLGWLEYSLKRALGIECTDEAEKKMGEEHICGTIQMLNRYDKGISNIIAWLKEMEK